MHLISWNQSSPYPSIPWSCSTGIEHHVTYWCTIIILLCRVLREIVDSHSSFCFIFIFHEFAFFVYTVSAILKRDKTCVSFYVDVSCTCMSFKVISIKGVLCTGQFYTEVCLGPLSLWNANFHFGILEFSIFQPVSVRNSKIKIVNLKLYNLRVNSKSFKIYVKKFQDFYLKFQFFVEKHY